MCGIVGYIGKKDAPSVILEGLRRLEYRGYDSAGVAVVDASGKLEVVKKAGRVEALAQALEDRKMHAHIGIGHTRWATHGGATDQNAHPHLSSDGKVAVVHNGVIENYQELKTFLSSEGFTFSSQTDTEVLANLIAYCLRENNTPEGESPLVAAVRRSLKRVSGAYGVAVLSTQTPTELVVARKSSPLAIGAGAGDYIVGSDPLALAGYAERVTFLEDGQIAEIRPEGISVSTLDQERVEPHFDKLEHSYEHNGLGDFDHYMQKEIFEQPISLENAFRGRIVPDNSTLQFGGLNMSAADLREINRIVMIGCGTAWHACLMGKYLIEKYARIPVEVDYGSEFRYRNPPLGRHTLVVAVSQSGETIDTLEGIREAKRRGFKTLAITNGVGSSIAREVDGGIYQHAGPEVGVASTKAFTSQVLICAMFAFYLARMRDMDVATGAQFVDALKQLPNQVTQVLKLAETIRNLAERFARYDDFLFLGRLEMFPIALEGALKLKEISYIHAEGFPAAEMKHGVIALVCPQCPTLVLLQKGPMIPKTLSNMAEIGARGGPLIALYEEGIDFNSVPTPFALQIPTTHPALFPILATLPLQLLAYYAAIVRGRDVDKPRNLAKSVTVE
jgi:glucosamine--fructose-6-phosphate aminotransferase (isomerizing)